MKHYLWRNLVAFDQLVNTLFGGDPDETISSRWGRYENRHNGTLPWYLRPMAWVVNKLDPGHFQKHIGD